MQVSPILVGADFPEEPRVAVEQASNMVRYHGGRRVLVQRPEVVPEAPWPTVISRHATKLAPQEARP